MNFLPPIDYDQIADLYDTYVTCDFDIPFFLEEARKVSGKVLELMAGTGRLSIPLIEAGVNLTCVDASAAMLERLRFKLRVMGLTAKLQQADIRLYTPEDRFELALIPFHSLSELISRNDQQAVLTNVYKCLVPGGWLICALHNPAVRIKSADGSLQSVGRYTIESGSFVVSATETHDAGTGIVDRKQFYEIFDSDGVLRSRRVQEMRFSLISYEEFDGMATAAGFKRRAVYGEYDCTPYERERSRFMIWVVERRGIANRRSGRCGT